MRNKLVNISVALAVVFVPFVAHATTYTEEFVFNDIPGFPIPDQRWFIGHDADLADILGENFDYRARINFDIAQTNAEDPGNLAQLFDVGTDPETLIAEQAPTTDASGY